MDPSFSERKFTLGGSSECWGGWIRPFEISTYQNSFEQFSDQTWPNLNLSKYDQESLNLLNSPINISDFSSEKLAD
tara:strand:+ start:347 stop:574 length:228 start_codon:yes stop_codon:yes gene_type:complete